MKIKSTLNTGLMAAGVLCGVLIVGSALAASPMEDSSTNANSTLTNEPVAISTEENKTETDITTENVALSNILKAISVDPDGAEEVLLEDESEPIVCLSGCDEPGIFYLPQCPLDAQLQQYIYDLAIKKNIPVDMMFTIPIYESGWNTNALSATNDYGLYQINICNHRGYAKLCGTENDPYNPYVNSLWAATMLENYLRQFEAKYSDYATVVDRTLSCYNGGPNSRTREGYISKYDEAHKNVVEWMTEAGYDYLIKAY